MYAFLRLELYNLHIFVFRHNLELTWDDNPLVAYPCNLVTSATSRALEICGVIDVIATISERFSSRFSRFSLNLCTLN